MKFFKKNGKNLRKNKNIKNKNIKNIYNEKSNEIKKV
jgi:hypothetical protein